MPNGSVDFTHKRRQNPINYQAIFSTNYAKNMFFIMDHWKVLPTDERFKKLTPEMINLLINGYNQKIKDENAANHDENSETASFVDMDTSWKNEVDENGDFDPIQGNQGLMDNIKKVLREADEDEAKREGEAPLTDKQKESQANLAQKALSNTLKNFSKKRGEK